MGGGFIGLTSDKVRPAKTGCRPSMTVRLDRFPRSLRAPKGSCGLIRNLDKTDAEVRVPLPEVRAGSTQLFFCGKGPTLSQGECSREVPAYRRSSSGSRSTSSSISMSRYSCESNTCPQSRHSTYSTSSSRATMRTLGCLQAVSMGSLSMQRVLLGKIVPAGLRLSNQFLHFW